MKADNKIDGGGIAAGGCVNITEEPVVIFQPPNFVMVFDDMGYENPYSLRLEFTVKKTITARIKYWLLCKFFPFKIVRWDA